MMHWKPREWTLIGMLLLAMPGAMTVMKVTAAAQATSGSAIATTQVTDTVHRADGTAAAGTVIVNWQAFTTAGGQAVPSGSTSATITGGALSLQLVPNAGSTPMGTYYTAVYHLDDGSVSREFWVVPVSQFPVLVSAIRSTVLPTSVAMQTVSKSYVDTAIAAAVTGHPLAGTIPYVLKTGDTMTGALVLPGDPTAANDAADKHYVDVNIAATAGGLGQKVSTLPSATQTVTQPVGTQLQVNNLNGEEYASQYVTGLGNNGIANALAGPDCASGCDLKVERSYISPENYFASGWNSGSGGTHIEDDRNGQRRDSFLNPTSALRNGDDAGQLIDVTSTRNTAAEFAAGGSGDPGSLGLIIRHQGLTGGSNLFPATIENVPYFKTNYSALLIAGNYNTMGQHVLNSQTINCYGVGDCLIGSQFVTSSGGFRDEADEGTHPMDLQIREDWQVFQGVCSAGCAPGSTVVTVAASSAGGTQGEGRYLIDKNPAKVIATGVLTGGSGQVGGGPGPTANFSGTNFPVSVFLATAQTLPSQANNVAPGTVTVAIATSGVTAGFATNTAAIPGSSGVACVVDQPNGGNPHNYEMATYTVVDGTHLQMTLNKVHRAGATIAFGGLCGYGLEQTVDTVGNIRQVFPVIGSSSATSLYYAGGITSIVGLQGNTSAFLNVSLPIAAIARNAGVVTVTTAGNLPVDVNGLTMTVSGVTDQSYNGSFIVTSTGANTLTYVDSGANSTSTGGSVSKLTGGYALYPMAEVLGVFNAATKGVDGQLTLAANTVAWGANDPVEEPHYYQEHVAADLTYVGQTTPRPTEAQTAGVQYEVNVGPGLSGWSVNNIAPATNYFGNGGTHSVPGAAYVASGIWQRTMDMQAGEESVFSVHCNSHGCGKWNSGYDLFQLDATTSVDRVSFQPQTSTLQLSVRGTSYQFSPQAFTAGTINAGTVNATQLNGAVSAAQLPLFGISGSGHGPGAVPDPGATAGTTRYLREDGTWAVPTDPGGLSVGGGLSGAGAPIAGAAVDYNFLQGSGTVVTDNSGNGNNGTLGAGALAPTWTATGLNFTGQSQVALPSTLNGMNTFVFGVYLQPLTTVQPANSFPMLMGSSLAGSGVNLTYDYSPSTQAGLSQDTYILAPTIFGSGIGGFTAAKNLVSGFHVLTYTLAAPGSGKADVIYIDGQRASYNYNFTSAGLQTSGHLFLGSSNVGMFGTSGLNGTLYRFAAFPTNGLTDAQVLQISNQITQDVVGRGVLVKPAAAPLPNPVIQFLGDSITAGLGASAPYSSLLSLTNQPGYQLANWGISGARLQAMLASEPNRAAPLCPSNQGPSIAIVFAGTNDFLASTQTPTTVMANLGGEIQLLKTAGCRVFVGTMLSRTGTDGAGNSFDSDKNAYDSLILTGSKAYGADGVIDFAANPLLGADGANANPNATACSGGTTFQNDNIHPTSCGQGLLANAASNALNYYFGFNQMNPHVVTAASYTMQAGDGYITASPTANQTLTLPDCMGQSGAVYTVTNLQSAFTVGVLAGSSSQLINGLAVGTVVPVPANGSLMLRDVPNPKTVSGCHWEM
jgi:trimeric autotransporter adhesin